MVSVFQAVVDLEKQNQIGVLCTVVRTQGSTPRHAGSKMLVRADGSIVGTIGGGELESRVITEAFAVLNDGQPRLLEYNMADPTRGDPGVCGGTMEIFVEPINPKPVLVIIGGGHVGNAVAHLAHWLGFWVVINDDRKELATPEAVPSADDYINSTLEELPERLKITPWTYLVLTTRGVDIDVAGLPALLTSPAAYIGVIGSQRRWETTRKQLQAIGISEDRFVSIHSPIGLEIHAETPEEIAVSIMAEIIKHRRSSSKGA